jgi:hypothetical protein
MKRTITARAAARTMTLGDVREFLASIDSVPDEAMIKVRTTLFGHHLRTLTVEEDDVGFRAYVQAVGADDDKDADPPEARRPAGGRKAERAAAAAR